MNGTHNGQPLYQAGMKQKWVWFDTVTGGYVISDVVGAIGDYAWSQDTPTTNPDDSYHVTGSHCEGAPVVGPITTEGPHGLICLWFGSIASIPAGWVLCDGLYGTPDLRGRFVPGAGGTLSPGSAGGTAAHSHTYSGTFGGSLNTGNVLTVTTPIGQRSDGFTGGFGGNTSTAANLPPYYALAYIMHL